MQQPDEPGAHVGGAGRLRLLQEDQLLGGGDVLAARRAYDMGWQRRLYDAGYAGLNWPKDAGGQDVTPTQQLIFLEETEAAGAPYVGAGFVGLLHAGPTIAAEGSPEQRARWLPP
ncbi:acyl-CoA dehydrogenase family protein, partial [Streptomyces albus]|uniref:acyl-CoA dehydrogenase family protein n=1 Tax=Streptomyces albus TaxID=1888 RepID=UPI00201086C9